MVRKFAIVLMVVLAAMLVVAGCGDKKKAKTTKKTTTSTEQSLGVVVRVTVSDFKVVPGIAQLKAGDTVFSVTNNGKTAHEFEIVAAPGSGKLPTKGNKATVEALAEISSIKPGETQQTNLKLKKGKYLLICNLPGHYEMGMSAPFEAV